MNFEYLRKVHKGDSFWLNSALITSQRLSEFVANEVRACDVNGNTGWTKVVFTSEYRVRQVPKQRTIQFFHLGMSLAKLTERPADINLIRALAQAFEVSSTAKVGAIASLTSAITRRSSNTISRTKPCRT